MDLKQEHIKFNKLVGKMPNGTPVLYIETHGGLTAFFGNIDGKIETLGASPHKAISQFMADKRFPGISWNRQALMEESDAA